MNKRCKVCHILADLDEQGRCMACAVALAATNAGMHYGDYMALQGYHEPFNLVTEYNPEIPVCKWCRKPFVPKSKRQKYCSYDCCKEKELYAKREWSREHYRGKGINDE